MADDIERNRLMRAMSNAEMERKLFVEAAGMRDSRQMVAALSSLSHERDDMPQDQPAPTRWARFRKWLRFR